MIVAVYCSANDCISERYKQLGDCVGKWLANNGFSMLYGGATGGLMTRVSDAYRHALDILPHPTTEQRLIGVVPQRIIDNGRLATNCDELHTVPTMSTRKQMMRDIADVFVCLPGSYGTLDEMYDVIASGTVGEHHKPIYILNYEGFYDYLREEAALMKRHNFLPKEEKYIPNFINTLEELFDILQSKNQSL